MKVIALRISLEEVSAGKRNLPVPDKMKINKRLLPIKAHYFFFMAAMGPILPQMAVFGKQLGISPDIMGFVTSVLPILYILAKPAVGFLADYFSRYRKMIFVLIIVIMTICFAGFEIVPPPKQHLVSSQAVYNFTLDSGTQDLNQCKSEFSSHDALCRTSRHVHCFSTDGSVQSLILYLTDTSNNTPSLCWEKDQQINLPKNVSFLSCSIDHSLEPDCLYNSLTFWSFVLLMCFGTIGFNVTNCISDAICFDMLGESQEMKYGAQRVWGTIGFGASALIAGFLTDIMTTDVVKSITPAIIVMIIASGLDLFSVAKLKLPKLSSADSILREVWTLLRQPRIAIFLLFATIAGIIDSFIIYFMFWHLEEVAAETGYMGSIKLIEGCVVAAECLGGEIIFFLISGRILNRLGYVHCLSLCFFTYSVRLGLISIIPNPWWLVAVELLMQGCTYALCYTCIVAYASAIAPPGTSATIQGIVAGMDDGLGFSIGSLIGGQLYRYFGGARSFQMFSAAAFATFIAHIFLRPASKHETHISRIGYQSPTEQIHMTSKT